MKCAWTCLVEYPFTDGTGSKVRPVLVVSRDAFNRGDDVIVVPISSQPGESDPYSIYVRDDSPHFPASGLKFSSAIKWGKPFTISKVLLIRRLGTLDDSIMSQVSAEIRSLFTEP